MRRPSPAPNDRRCNDAARDALPLTALLRPLKRHRSVRVSMVCGEHSGVV